MRSSAEAYRMIFLGFFPHASYAERARIGRILFPPAKREYRIASLSSEGSAGIVKYNSRYPLINSRFSFRYFSMSISLLIQKKQLNLHPLTLTLSRKGRGNFKNPPYSVKVSSF